MNGRFLLDTNIIIALFAGEVSVLDKIRQAAEVFLPNIVFGELYFGACKSIRVQENLARINQLAQTISILLCDLDTSRMYGEIKSALRAKGRPIPDNDIWIAALAKQRGFMLVTRDSHFEEIDGLEVEVW